MRERSPSWIAALGLLLLALALAGCQVGTDRSAVKVDRAEGAPTYVASTATASEMEVVALRTPEKSLPALDNAPTPEHETMVDAKGVYLRGFAEEGEPLQGNLAADVVIEELSTFQCPYCGKFFGETYPQLMANYVETV